MRARWWAGIVALCLAGALLLPAVDREALASTARALRANPGGLVGVLALYFAAFAVRALLMCRALPGVSFGHSLAALHVALAGNKLLPLRLGEALRVTSLVRRTGVGLAEAGAATIVLRGADVLAVLGLAAALAPHLLLFSAVAVWIVAAAVAGVVVAGIWWLRRLGHRLPAAGVAAGAVAAWVLESGVLWQAARWAGIELSAVEAVLVTAVTNAAQVFAVAPAGLGTYEAAATGILVATTG
ncbi:MAG: lysylphosphatidylglycerol synthase domain-containing protein, partial [Gemmatimonadales bacterium]